MIERLGLLSDIHGNMLALEAVLAHAKRQAVTRFVNLGDILYGPLFPRETYELLQTIDVGSSIAGNQDRLLVQSTAQDRKKNPTLDFVLESMGKDALTWIRGLPSIEQAGQDLLLCHGTPSSDTTYLLEDISSGRAKLREPEEIARLLQGTEAPIVLCGHSHTPRLVQLADGRLIANPGSVGLPAYDDDLPVPHVMENYSPHASYAVLERDIHGYGVSFHRVAYDWQAASRRALELGRPDWAKGIATGWMH